MSKHTPKPWFYHRQGFPTVYIEARIGGGMLQEIAACGPCQDGTEQQDENAHRIVACVNACRVLPTDELERKGLVAAVCTELLAADERAECQEREVRRLASVAANAKNQLSDALNQRDQLLAVLDEISNLPSYRQDECSEMARDAIAKAKGIDHE